MSEPMQDTAEFFRTFGKLRPQTFDVIGGDAVSSAPEWKANRAFLHMRRGLALLLREVASRNYTPSDVLTFASTISEPVFLRDPSRGAAHCRDLASHPLMATIAVPLKCAEGVFEECWAAKDSSLGQAIHQTGAV